MDPLRLGDLHCKVSETSRKASVLWNQESGGSGGIISVVSYVNSSPCTSSPWSDNTSKNPKSMVPNGTFFQISVSSSSQAQMSPIVVSFGSAISSDVTYAPTAETFSVNFTLPSSFAFAWFVTRFSEDFLAVPGFQAAQFSIFTFHRFVTAGKMVTIFVTQISHHHWSKITRVRLSRRELHLRINRYKCCCAVNCFKICGAHGEQNSQSNRFLGNWSPVRSRWRCPRFSQAWNGV